MIDNNIELLFAQETWVRKCDGALFKEIRDYGYDLLSFRKARKIDSGGGVGVIHKIGLRTAILKRTYNYKSFEHMSCKVFTKDGTFLFVNVYRPPYSSKNKCTVKFFLEEFSLLLQELSCMPFFCIIIGDFNLHVELLEQSEANLPEYKRAWRKYAQDFSTTSKITASIN